MFFSAILYFLFVQLSLLLPGYVLFQKLKLFKRTPGLQLCMAYVVSLALFAFFAAINYGFNIPPEITRFASYIILAGSLFLFIKDRYYRPLFAHRFPLICLLAVNILSLSFISLSFNAPREIVPDPQPISENNYSVADVKVLNVAQTRANDNYVPYRQAQFFVNRSDPARDSFIGEWGVTFFQRTPLMGAVVAHYFNLLNDKPPIAYIWSANAPDPSHTFLKFQLIAQILNGIFILPAFFILSQLFNRKTAAITCLFLATSQFFVYNSFFSWPKSLVAFFVLTAWLLLLQRSPLYTVLAGIVSGIAYLTHDLTSLYIATSLVYLGFSRRFRDMFLYVVPAMICAAPWMWLTSIRYHKPSSFIYYPFSVNGIPPADKSDVVMRQFFDTSPFTIILIRLKSLLYMLSPYQLIFSEGGQELGRRFWALGLYSIPGALGIGLLIPAYASLIALFKKYWQILILILMPVIFFALVTGWALTEVDSEGAFHFAQAAIVLWSGLAIYWLLKLKWRWLVMVAYCLNALQFGFFLLYSYRFKEELWLRSLSDIACLVLMTAIFAGAGWLIVAVSQGKKFPMLSD